MGDLNTRINAVQSLGQLRVLQAASKLLELLQDDQLYGPQAGLYRAVANAFQESSGIKKDLVNAFPLPSTTSFNVAGAGTSLPEMMGLLGSENFQKLNYLSQVRKVSPSTFQIALSAIKFFFEYTLQRQWATLELVRPAREQKLPAVLSVDEVRRARYRVCLSTIYACGLRLQEGVHLQVVDIDSQRMLVYVHRGKGSKERYVQFNSAVCSLPGKRNPRGTNEQARSGF